MAYHLNPPMDTSTIKVDDTVCVRWGSVGIVNARVTAVYEDGFRAKRWNKKGECWTQPRRFWRNGNDWYMS